MIILSVRSTVFIFYAQLLKPSLRGSQAGTLFVLKKKIRLKKKDVAQTSVDETLSKEVLHVLMYSQNYGNYMILTY